MSGALPNHEKVTVVRVMRKKHKNERIVCLTAYDYPTARLVAGGGVDVILVGDSAANVVYGHPTTLSIGMEEMLYHTRAVAAGAHPALVVADMPFMSYQCSVETALENAGRFLKAGAEAVKLEGAGFVLEVVKRLVDAGIPVMGHLGLTPQSVHRLGGYRLQAKRPEEREQLLADAVNLEKAGCFSLVLEKIPAELAGRVTKALRIPTIGIGAGPECDGQVLVIHDLLGLVEGQPLRFVKRYAELGREISRAVEEFCADVRAGRFPAREHSFYTDETGK